MKKDVMAGSLASLSFYSGVEVIPQEFLHLFLQHAQQLSFSATLCRAVTCSVGTYVFFPYFSLSEASLFILSFLGTSWVVATSFSAVVGDSLGIELLGSSSCTNLDLATSFF